MVRTEHSIVGQVYAAKADAEAADALIQQYMGFIRSEVVKFTHTAPENGHEDELSIAMLAFYEAVLAYEKSRGAFLPYAARAIKNRLIDHYRVEKRHGNVISLSIRPAKSRRPGAVGYPAGYGGPSAGLCGAHGQPKGNSRVRPKAGGFWPLLLGCGGQLPPPSADFGGLPPGAGLRPLPAGLAGTGGGETGKLPLAELAAGAGVEKKTLERHRKYLVAILLAFTNGYEIIRGHLCQIGPKEGGWQAVKYLVMETHPAYAVLLDEEGRFLKAANLHYQVGDTVQEIVELRRPAKQAAPWAKALSGAIGLAACFCLVFFGYYQPNFAAYGTLRMRVNPDVQLTLSRTERVLELEGLNPDGAELVGGVCIPGENSGMKCWKIWWNGQSRWTTSPTEGRYPSRWRAPTPAGRNRSSNPACNSCSGSTGNGL